MFLASRIKRYALLLLLVASIANAQSIFTVAGGGIDDGRLATAAAVKLPTGVAVDASGNLYIADGVNNRVRKVAAVSGIIQTVAGNRTPGSSGDGGPATEAGLSFPYSVALDTSGNLYIADRDNNRIRKVDAATGIISTVAGNGAAGFSGDGGPATAAALLSPYCVTLDSSGNLYIADTANNRIRKVDSGSGTISTVAGNGVEGFSGDGGSAKSAALKHPRGVAVDGSGNLYIADYSNVRRVDATSGIITSVAGNGTQGFSGDGGPATAAALYNPWSVTLDPSGNLYIADVQNNRVRKVTGGIISTIAGTGSTPFSGDGGPATAASLYQPRSVALDHSGNIYVADFFNHRIRKIDGGSGIISTVAGNGSTSFGDNGPAIAAGLYAPVGVTVDASGNIFIADPLDNRVRKVDARSGIISTMAGNGLSEFTGDGGPATAAGLYWPWGVALDESGNLYIADSGNNRIRKVDTASGIISTVAGNGTAGFSGDGGAATAGELNSPLAAAVDRSGNLFIADFNRIRKVEAGSGTISTVAGNGTAAFSGDGGPATAATLSSPSGLTLNAAGDLFVADFGNSRIRKIAAGNGTISTVAGNGKAGFSGDGGPATAAALNSPEAVALDGSGNLYIADADNNRIRKVDGGSGAISTLAGTGIESFSGDGGPATAATLSVPYGVAADAAGNVIIADTLNGLVRAVLACTTVSAPGLTSPADNAQSVSSPAQFAWSAAKAAFRYDFYLDKVNPPQKIVAPDISTTAYAASNLDSGATYFWKVAAKGDPFCSSFSTASSEVRSFTTSAGCSTPAAFDLVAPADGATGVASAPQLSWKPAAGASVYDVFLGPASPSTLAASTGGTTLALTGLVPGSTYRWMVVAHAACDSTKTATTAIGSFQTAGSCTPAGAFTLNAPSDAATAVPLTTTLEWSASASASTYDVYLGTSSSPPLYLADVPKPRIGVSGLEASRLYYWRVVAKVVCDPTKNIVSSTNSFTTATTCTVPGAPSITFVPSGDVTVGQTYTVAWRELPELDSSGYYLVERSSSAAFATILDSQQSFSTSASFISAAAGTYYHRVRAVPGCDPSHPGPVSPARSVNVVSGAANVIFTVQPQAVITALGERLEDKHARFTLENLGSTPLQVVLSKAEINSPYFFTWRDPMGGDPFHVTLEPRTPKPFDIQFSGPPTDQSGAYQGIIFVLSSGLKQVPFALVNLNVGGGTTARPVFLASGAPTEYAFFPGFPLGSDDTNRPPITVQIRNDGTSPMDLGAEIGPEVWLVPEAGWNASPIPPGATRSIRLTTQRSRRPNGSVLPRYTYFTVRSKNGESARLLVQDNDALPTSAGRTSLLNPGSRSLIVPGVVSMPPQFSRLRLTNVGSDAVQADLIFTPTGSDGLNAAAVKRATIVVPPNDVVTLTDPLVQVFGLTAPAEGMIEVRTAPEKIGFLVVSSSVFAPVPTGGGYSCEMPTLILGEGARLGSSHVIVGVSESPATRAVLTLVETSGTELVRVRVILFDSQGIRKGDRLVDVPRYGQTTIHDVVTALGGTEPLDGGRIELDVESGGGAVAGLVTMLDATRNNGLSLVSQPTAGRVSSSVYKRLQRARVSFANSLVTAVAPVVVNGLTSGGANQRTTMGFTMTAGSTLTSVVTYRPTDPAAPAINKSVPIPVGVVLQFDNVLEDLFGIPKGQAASGSVFIQAGAGAQIYARLSTLSGNAWAVTSGLPILPTLSDVLSSVSSKHPLYLDGLEQSIDPTRGTRWSVDINEFSGASGSVLVRLYEDGNRSVPIAEKRYDIGAYQQLKLDTVFSALGLDSDDRRKDRTNVMCTVSADGGQATISAVAVAVDNRTGDTRQLVFSPAGGVPSTGVLRITVVSPVAPALLSSGKRRAVHP